MSPPAPLTASPLSPAQFAEIQAAQLRSKKIRRAIGIAFSDAYFATFFAFATAIFVFFDPISAPLALALAFVAFNSFRGARRLKKFDPTAPKLLALNQLLLAAIIILYSAWSLWTAAAGKSEIVTQLDTPELKEALGIDGKRLAWSLALLIYGTLIVGTIIFQGLTALYYMSRKKYLLNYLQSTPDWITTLQKNQAGT